MDNIFNLFREVAQNNNAVAVETSLESISYKELLVRVLFFIDYLSVIDEQRIAIYCERMSINSIAMMFAIFARAKSCVLLDVKKPAEFNDKLLTSLECRAVFDQNALELIAKKHKEGNLCEYRGARIQGNQEGYVVTTSGSTGEPKIILGSHLGLMHFISWQKEQYFKNKYRVLQLTNCSFDVIYREILTTLISGSTLVIPAEDLKYQSGEKIKKFTSDFSVDVVYLVSSVADFWSSTIKDKTINPVLKLVFFAGEKLQKTTINNLFNHFKVEKMINLYGPSETTLAKFYFEFTIEDLQYLEDIPVGLPLPDTIVELTDNQEILIHTKYPSLGYLNVNPFIMYSGKSYYPTGDLGRIENGLLFIDGRIDDQVKVNGMRVHLNEVNARVKSVKGVEESIVLQDLKGRIIGFYTGNLSKETLYQKLREKSHHVTPSQLFHLSTMPHTASGKIDRNLLLAEINQKTEFKKEEDFLYAMWRKVTGYQGGIKETDNFFELGGDSIDIVHFIVELEEETGKKIAYWDIYENPVIKDFRELLNNKIKNNSIVVESKKDSLLSYPLTRQQNRYKNIYMPFVNSNWCNMIAVWDFGRVSFNDLQRALETVIERHDALQSFYSNGKMIVNKNFSIKSVNIDFIQCDDEEFDEVLENTRVREAEKIIDIEKWPLFSMVLIESQTKQKVIWNIHHLICDGFSQGIIQNELFNSIRGLEFNTKPEQYSYYAVNQTASDKEARIYWQNIYQNYYEKVCIDEQFPNFGRKGYETAIALDENLSKNIKFFAKKCGTTPFAVILSAYFLCLHHWYDKDDVVVGTPALGRKTKEEEKIVGNFISLVTIRSYLDFNYKCFKKYLAGIHKGIYEAIKYQDFQYDELLGLKKYPLEQDRFPLTTFFISMIDKKESCLENALSFTHKALGFDVKFDMMLYVDVYAKQFLFRLQYRRALFDLKRQEDFIVKMIENIKLMIGGD